LVLDFLKKTLGAPVFE